MNANGLANTTASNTHPLARSIRIGRRLGRFAEYWFLALGVLSIVGMVLGAVLGHGWRLDLTCLVYLAVAYGLRRFSNGARITALVLTGLYLVAALAFLEFALIRGTQGMQAELFGASYEDPGIDKVALATAAVVVVVGLPFGALLHPAASRLFRMRTRLRKIRVPKEGWG